MFNEVDRLILDSIVICSYCNGKNVSKCQGITTTLAGTGETRERGFIEHRPIHEHDNNNKDAAYLCYDCDKIFYIVPLDGCWCGWQQRFNVAMSKMTNWWNSFANKEMLITPKKCNACGESCIYNLCDPCYERDEALRELDNVQ